MPTSPAPLAPGEVRRRLLAAARIYLIVTPNREGRWEAAAEAALDTGLVGIVQLRAKGPTDAEIAAFGRRLGSLAARARIPWILNDRPDLALALGADGAHVGEDDVPPATARRLLGPDLLLGVSTHDEAEVAAAARAGPADYAGLGPCFPTGTKRLSRTPGGADLVRRCLPVAGTLPLFPIGGIGPANVRALVEVGATRVAVGAAVLEAADPVRALTLLHQALLAPPGPGERTAGRRGGGSPPGG